MGKRAHARHFVRVAHNNEWIRPLRSIRERALSFSLIWVDIHPAILETASADRLNVFPAHRREAFADQLYTFFQGYFHFLLPDGSPHIVIGQFLESQCFAANLEITMPDR